MLSGSPAAAAMARPEGTCMTDTGGDLVNLYRTLSIAFLGFVQQVAWLLWKLLLVG
jgi:hypothetical protein